MVEYRWDWGNCTIAGDTTNDALAHANPIRYRGYYYDDDTSLYYLNARYYSPKWHRFISPDDTAYLDPENVNGLNLYCYCNNDPVNLVDPSGHDWNWGTFINGLLMTATAIGAIALSVMTFGVATPLAMTIVAGVTLAAGVLTGVNGIATMVEAGTGYHFMRDGLFNNVFGLNDSAYYLYAGITEGVAAIGSMVLGIYRATPSGRRTMADNELYRIIDNPQRIQRYTFDQFGDLAQRSSWRYGSTRNGKGMRAVLNDKVIRYSMNGTRLDAVHFFGNPYWVVSSAKNGISKFMYLF